MAEEKLEARRKQILERQAVHKQDMQSRAAYFTQVEQVPACASGLPPSCKPVVKLVKHVTDPL